MGLEVNNPQAEDNNGNERDLKQRQNPAREFQEQTQAAPSRANNGTAPSLRNQGRVLARAFGRNDISEVLNKTLTAFNDLFASQGIGSNDLSQFQVLGLDSAESHTTLSAVIITLGYELDGTTHVAYYVNLLEASAPPLAPSITEWNGRRYEVPQVAGDVLNDRFLDRVEEVVAAHYNNGRKINFLDAGSNVIYSEVDAEKNAENLRQYAFYATAAVQSVLNQALNLEPRFDLSWIDDGSNLSVAVNFSNDQRQNAAGLPVRTDISIQLTADIKGEDGVRREPLTVTGGALELIYSPAQPEGQDMFSSFNRTQTPKTQLVVPQFTINTWDTLGKQITAEHLVLGLAQVAILSDKLLWVNSFTPRLTEGDDYRDIGALALFAGNPTPVDVKSNSFTREDFMSFFGQLCDRNLAFAMNIAECGDLTWVHRLVLDVALNVRNAEAQLREIFDHVTAGHFSTRFAEAGGGDMVIDSGNRVFDGYYRDERGEMRDLNDWDLLKWVNYAGKNDVETALAYQETFDNVDEPLDVRLDKRLRILQDVLGSSAIKVKGYSRQVYLPQTLIYALAQAVRDCGIIINRSNANASYGAARPRGNFRLQGLAGHDLGSDLFAAHANRTGDFNRPGRGVYTGRSSRGY